jgi:hypothetical protein
MKDGERVRAGWEALSTEVAQELSEWRAAHPRATLAEIEQRVAEATGRLQARYLSDLAHASSAADLGATPAADRPPCPACGGAVEPRGAKERSVLTPRQAAPLRLRRSYGVCAACGSGLFPPG